MILGTVLMVNAGLALQFQDQIESALGMTATAKDQQELDQIIPKVSFVDREPKQK